MEKLLTLSEVSALTHRSQKAVRMLISRGRFPALKIGSRIYFEEEELKRFFVLSRKTTAIQAAKNGTRNGMQARDD